MLNLTAKINAKIEKKKSSTSAYMLVCVLDPHNILVFHFDFPSFLLHEFQFKKKIATNQMFFAILKVKLLLLGSY